MMTRVGPMDRFDVCAAYNLWLQASHAGHGSREYARLSKLGTYFRPSSREEFVSGLSSDALTLYLALVQNPTLPVIPFVEVGGD